MHARVFAGVGGQGVNYRPMHTRVFVAGGGGGDGGVVGGGGDTRLPSKAINANETRNLPNI